MERVSGKFPSWSSAESFLDNRCRTLENIKVIRQLTCQTIQSAKKPSSNDRCALVSSIPPSLSCTSWATPRGGRKMKLYINCLRKGNKRSQANHRALLHFNSLVIESASSLSRSTKHIAIPTTSQSTFFSSLSTTTSDQKSLLSSNVLLATAAI